MMHHVMIGANDIDKSKDFYNAVLGVLGAPEPAVNVNDSGHTRLFYMHAGSVFCLTQPIDGEPVSVANGSTIGFSCDSPQQVKEFHDVAVANGATSIEEPPGPRSGSMGELHLCYFRDLDGHKICGIYRAG